MQQIKAIIAKAAAGQECTPEERAQIKNHVRDYILQPGTDDVKTNEDIQHYFPMEFGQGIDEAGEAGDDPEQDEEPAAVYFSAAGKLDIIGYTPTTNGDEITNADDLYKALDTITGEEDTDRLGDVIQLLYTNKSATKAIVKLYAIDPDFMGSWNLNFYGKRTHNL